MEEERAEITLEQPPQDVVDGEADTAATGENALADPAEQMPPKRKMPIKSEFKIHLRPETPILSERTRAKDNR
jgi:hypothetical protein